MALPDVPPGPDLSVAIIIESDAVLLMRYLGHGGRSYGLPSGFVKYDEDLESACLRGATEMIKEAAKDYSRQLGIDLEPDQVSLTLGAKIGEHREDARRNCHYFLVYGNKKSILSGPASQPIVPPENTFWPSYEWIAIADLGKIKRLYPDEALSMCELARSYVNSTKH